MADISRSFFFFMKQCLFSVWLKLEKAQISKYFYLPTKLDFWHVQASESKTTNDNIEELNFV